MKAKISVRFTVTSLYNLVLRAVSFVVLFSKGLTQITNKSFCYKGLPDNLADTIICQSQHLFIIMLQWCTSVNYCTNKGSVLFKWVMDKALGRRQLSIMKMNSEDNPSAHTCTLLLLVKWTVELWAT